MKDERHEAAAVVDDDVSRTYREIARERAPERLDRAVLEEAARAARPRYARSRAWTRPLAWAATIVLSVAIVLELTPVPAPDERPLEPAASMPVDAVDAPAAETLEEAAPAAAAPGRSADVLPKSPEKSNLMHKSSVPAPVEADAALRERQAAGVAAAPEPASATVEAAAFDDKDQELLRRADEMAVTQHPGSRQEAFAPAQASRSLAGAPETCSDEARRDPEVWLDCIVALEKAGFESAAAAERRALREAFPAFETP